MVHVHVFHTLYAFSVKGTVRQHRSVSDSLLVYCQSNWLDGWCMLIFGYLTKCMDLSSEHERLNMDIEAIEVLRS